MDKASDEVRNSSEWGFHPTVGKFRQLADWAPVSMAIFDHDMRYLELTQGWRDDCQIGDRDVIGLSHYDIFPELPEQWKDVHRRCLEGATERSESDRFVRPDGTTVWIRWEVKPWRDDSGNIGGIVMWSEDITARKKGEVIAQENERRFKAALANSQVVVWEQDLQLRYTWIYNPKLGYETDAVIGKTDSELMDPAYAKQLEAIKRRVIETGQATRQEVATAAPGGTFEYFDLCVDPLLNDSGHIVGITCAAADITERKRAEERLRLAAQAEALLLANNKLRDAILDSVPSLIAVLDRTGTIVAVNRTWRAFALANSAVPGEPASHTQIGTNYLDICSSTLGDDTDGSAALARDGILRVIQGRAPSFELEYPCHSPTQQRWFSLAVAPLNLDGHAVVVTHTDITQRWQQEQAEKEASENKFRLVADNTSDGILIVGADRQVQYVSPVYLKQLGYSQAEELGRTPEMVFSHIHPQDRDAMVRGIECAIESKESELLYSYRAKHQRGHYIWRESNARFNYDGDGNFTGMCIVARDITERMNANAALLEANHMLTQTRQQLRQLLAQNEATLENEKRHIAREVHDELGQVLTALGMDLSLAIIRHAGQVPNLLNELSGMQIRVDHAVQCVRNVANSLRPAVLDMGLVTAIEWLCLEFTKHGEVACALHGTDQDFEIDDDRAVVLFRIVQEALTNIRKYAQACEVDVTLEKREADLSVEICDNGLGFDPVAVAQRGTLGLLGMRERVRALGGTVDVNSAPGRGTTISVLIPLEPNVAKDFP